MDDHNSYRMSDLDLLHGAPRDPGRALPQATIMAAPGASMPPVHRGSMVPRPWNGFTRSLLQAGRAALLRLLAAQSRSATRQRLGAAAPQAWERAARARRRVLLALVLLSAGGATAVLSQLLPEHPNAWLRGLQVALFSVLFAWVSAGFFTALMGFWVLWRGDRHALSSRGLGAGALDRAARTAIIMPICNEQVSTVFAGLRATWESLAANPLAHLFDLYVLSDSSDPQVRAAELAAWAQLRQDAGVQGRIFYRWRQRRTKRKSGNVADFCRRWGRDYRYMVVLDADSVMTGECLEKLVRLMEAHPRAGIIQTAPQTCGITTVHARAQQFASRVAGRLFTAGMQYWQLGESHYWGHNAIIRVAPFMQHCGLAPLSGRGGLSGEILSHDFVEAALMRRAGYQVWLVNDLAGSYEQQPPNLIEELLRDRRWCQGNLQNARLIAEPGLHGVHRAMLLTGTLAYLSAPLWLGFVLLGVGLWFLAGPAATGAAAADPTAPLAVAPLWLATATMLTLPRVLGVLAIVLRGEQRAYGGVANLVKGTVFEGALSVLQAPVRMMAHTLFVFVALSGLRLDWKSPPREATDLRWSDAAGRFGAMGALVGALAALAFVLQPVSVLWLAPMILPLLLAIPLAVLTGRATIGERLMAMGLLRTPEEHRRPAVLRQAWAYAQRPAAAPAWRDLLTDPALFETARAAMGARNTAWGLRGRSRRLLMRGMVTLQDTERLTRVERMRLLSEPQNWIRLRDQLAAHERLLPRRRASDQAGAAAARSLPALAPRIERRAPARLAQVGMAGA